MSTKNSTGTQTMSGRTWDRYLETWQGEHNADGKYEWPGDEWGTPASWDELYANLFETAGVAGWQHAVEIGPGSGKYSDRVLRGSHATIRAYDVSAEFMRVCEQRCAPWIDANRLSLHLIEGQSPTEMLDDLAAVGLLRELDAIFSIDAMVHVDLQYLIVYFMVAALSLRTGGKLVLTLSNATSEEGFDKLIHDIGWTYPQQADPNGSGKFEWLSPEIVRFALSRLGFDVWMPSGEGRDIWLIATLVDVSRATELEARLRSAPEPHRHLA
jgi:hypothetical protein